MVTRDDNGGNKSSEGSLQKGEKRCFDLFATLLLAHGDDETSAKRGQEEQERNMLMIHTITRAATKIFSLGKRKIDDDDDHDESNNQENNIASSSSDSSRSLVESKRRRVVVSSDEPIRAEPIREIKPPVKESKGPVKRKEPVRREPRVTPGWVIKLMKTYKGRGDAKMIFEKVLTNTDLQRSQARLLMPFNQMADMNFLTEAELKILDEHHKQHKARGHGKKKRVDDSSTPPKKGVDVIFLHRTSGGDKKSWNLNMRIWEMRSTFNYALCTGWNQLVFDNKLQRKQTITLWSFHSHDGKLYFAFDPPTQDEDPFVCEEANSKILPEIPRRSRTPRVWIQDPPTSDSTNPYLEGGFDLNRTPPEDTEMDPDLEAVQETHIRTTSLHIIMWTSQVAITETQLVSWMFLEEGRQLCSM